MMNVPEEEQKDQDDVHSHSSSSLEVVDDDGRGADKEADEHKIELAKNEDRAVWWLRGLVFSILVCLAVTLCVFVYVLSKRSEKDDFEGDAVDLGEKVVESFEATFKQRLEIIKGFGMDLTSYANDNAANTTWPFITLPNFEYRGGNAAKLANVIALNLLVVVQPDQRADWEEYANLNQGWRKQGYAIRKGIAVEDVEEGVIPPILPYITPNIMDGLPSPEKDTFYLPFWQEYPAIPFSLQNNDASASLRHADTINAVTNSLKPVFPASHIYNRSPLFNQYLEAFENSGTRYEDDPVLAVHYPVLDRLDESEDRHLVGMLVCAVYWRTFFGDILPSESSGSIVVLKNSCGQEYTYRIDGRHGYFLGDGDLHDSKFDHLMVESSADLTSSLGVDMTQKGNCHYFVQVFPSQDLEDSYYTNMPLLYTVALACLFVFTSAVFILYDYFVERRQRIVMKSAVQSGALVSSLFPEAVRERLYEEREQKQHTKSNDWGADNEKMPEASAIASLYPHVTVLFADVAGFTKWSSSRSPCEVFQLLETIYGAFDKIAQRRKVYKIETIGDCYVATTGLPHPQGDHAQIMVKFANECMLKLQQLLQDELVDSLGSDTADLAMRFGLHSGPVTAGVLRGDKSRFQLFGDTVNTAARMESNGIKGRIHVSEQTANELRQCGKSHWLTKRDELVAAKGKGELQTYWVSVLSNAKTTISTSSRQLSIGRASSMSSDGLGVDHDQNYIEDSNAIGAHDIVTLQNKPTESLEKNLVEPRSELFDC